MNKTILRIAGITALAGLTIAFTRIRPTTGDNKGIDIKNFDNTVSPRTDFYSYINGGWAKLNPIPASEVSWGSFNELNDKNQANLHLILNDALADKNAVKGSASQIVRDFYAMAMDTVKIEKEGITPLNAELKIISDMKTPADLIRVLAHEHLIQSDVMFNLNISPDMKESKTNAVYLFQGGLGLPEKDYYLSEEPQMKEIRNQYTAHIAKMFELAGVKKETAKQNASVVMSMENELAKHSMAAVELRNVQALYNKMSMKELQALTPAIDWQVYFKTMELTQPADLIVAQPDFIKELNKMIGTGSISDWQVYFRWHLLSITSNELNKAVDAEDFNFYGTILTGAREQKTRWKRCLRSTDASVGDALGQLYVAKYFTADSKKRVNDMVSNLIAAYQERIETRDWMSPETKKQAVDKLQKIIRKLGYTDKWKDYSKLDIKRDSYLANYLRTNTWEVKRNIAKFGKPVDMTEWGMTPPTVNAYYNPNKNEIVFPAGIMQPPFFNPEADDAVNYGAMGSVIGHEITHGFDDEGSQFDAEGNLKNWWTDADKKNFEAKTKILVSQFEGYYVLDSVHVNGELTLGENIADLGGLTIGYYAYKHSLLGKPVPPKIDGFTGEQRFFMSWAQGWRTNMRPEYLKQMIKVNNHAPPQTRVDGPLSNMTEFYEAFGVKEGDKMYRKPEDRAVIW